MPIETQNIKKQDDVLAYYERLMQTTHGLKNDHILASMLATQCVGGGAMPSRLGLNRSQYERMMQLHFSRAQLPQSFSAEFAVDKQRSPEQDELRELLMGYCSEPGEEGEWMTQIVVSGCMGGDHLWQDLGLWSRVDLSELMQKNFTELAARNDRDMKWKKFLYKQLCLAEGVYVCRSPSCEVCPDYAGCFGPEE